MPLLHDTSILIPKLSKEKKNALHYCALNTCCFRLS